MAGDNVTIPSSTSSALPKSVGALRFVARGSSTSMMTDETSATSRAHVPTDLGSSWPSPVLGGFCAHR